MHTPYTALVKLLPPEARPLPAASTRMSKIFRLFPFIPATMVVGLFRHHARLWHVSPVASSTTGCKAGWISLPGVATEDKSALSGFKASFDIEEAAAAAAEANVEEILAGAGDAPPLSVSYTSMPPSFLEITKKDTSAVTDDGHLKKLYPNRDLAFS